MTDPSQPPDTPRDEALPELLLAAAFGRSRAGDTAAATVELEAGVEVGEYCIVRRIGGGGMGIVYEAEQRAPERRVALKLLAPTQLSRAMVRRFQREAHVLARLQHPGIAQIHAAGSVTPERLGIPVHYFAMELVEGPQLDDWVRLRALDLPARVELVARVCDAVQHAHQRGVIHRDLKPSNVLVASGGTDAVGQPKVLDFGVARATGELHPEGTRVTLTGQVVGTLAYMSPEQAGGASEPDTRADVYSLGVILYQLIGDALPVDVANCSLVEAARRIRDETPTRVSELCAAADGELDTIVAHALAKEPGERYASAAELAADLRRWLVGEPIHARDHSPLYLLRKAIARNRALVGVAATAVLALAVLALVALREADRSRELARAEGRARNELAQTASRLEVELARSNLERGYLLSSLGNLEIAGDVLWREFLRRPEDSETLWALRDFYQRHPCVASTRASSQLLWKVVALPDGQRVASIGQDGALREHRLPDLATREIEPRRTPGILTLLPVRERRELVLMGNDGRIEVLDADSLAVLRTIRAREPGVDPLENAALDLAPDGGRYVAGFGDGTVREGDLAGGEPAIRARFPDRIFAVAYSPDGASLAVAFGQGELALVSASDGAERFRVRAHDQDVSRLVFSSDGARLYSGSRDRRVRVWDTASGSRLANWSAPNGSVRQIGLEAGRALVAGWFSLSAWDLADGRRSVLVSMPTDCWLRVPERGLVLTSGHGELRAWDSSVLDGPATLTQVAERAVARFLCDGELIVIGDTEGNVRVVRTSDGVERWRSDLHAARVRSLASTPDGRRLFTGGDDGCTRVFDAATGACLLELRPSLALATGALAASDDGASFAYVADKERVEVRDARTFELLRALPSFGQEVTCLAFLPGSQRVAAAVRERRVRIFDALGVLERELESPSDLWAIAVSSDGTRLAATTWKNEVAVWDLATGSLLRLLRGHGASVWDADFLPGSARTLASSAGDGHVRVWDVDSGRCLMVLDELDGWDASSIDFARDSPRLLVCGTQGRVRVLDLGRPDVAIRGNLRFQIERLATELAGEPGALAARALATLDAR